MTATEEIAKRKKLDDKLKVLDQCESQWEYLYAMTHFPSLFCATYFGYELAPFQVQMMEYARNNRRSLILVPKGHGKSSLISKCLPIMEMCCNPNVRIILIMKTAEDSSSYANIIRTELTDNQKLIADFGLFQDPNAWSSQSFNIAQRQIKDPHYTMEIYGVGGKYLGHRSEITICYSEDTEVLTDSGFKTFPQLTEGDRVATLSKDGFLEYQKPDTYIANHFNGELYEFNGKSVDFAVTPGHKMYVSHRDYPSGWRDFGLEPVDGLYGNGSLRFKKDCRWGGRELSEVVIPSEDYQWPIPRGGRSRSVHYPELRLQANLFFSMVGFWLAEGSFSSRGDSKNALRFSQNVGPDLDAAKQLLSDLGFEFKEYSHSSQRKGRELVINDKRLATWFYQNFGSGSKNKSIPSWMKDAGPGNLRHLLEWFLRGDGCDNGHTPYVCTSSKRLSDDLFEVALKCGYTPRLTAFPPNTMVSPTTGRAYNTATHYTVTLASRLSTPSLSHATRNGAWKRTPYVGSVYCVSVPNHTLYVRRNGASFWCGNCDDIVTEENSWTRDQRDKLKARFETAIQTGPQAMWPLRNPSCRWEEMSANLKVPKGIYWPKDVNYDRLIVCGTRFHPLDLYRKLEDDKSFKKLYFDCWQDPECTKPIWPSVWTKQKLDDERGSGLLSFNKRYRNIAVDESELGFRHEWVFGGELEGEEFPGCINRNRSWGEYPDNLYLGVGVDPASGLTGKYSTFPSFVCAGVDLDEPRETRTRYLIDIFRKQTGFDELIDVMLDGKPSKGIPGFRALYDYQVVSVEKNGYGNLLVKNDRMKAAEARGMRILQPWTQARRMDPVEGAFSMQGIIKQGLLDIPYKTEGDQKKAQEFIDQLETFPKGIVDYIMSFFFIELLFRTQMGQAKVTRRTPGRQWAGKTIPNPFFERMKLSTRAVDNS